MADTQASKSKVGKALAPTVLAAAGLAAAGYYFYASKDAAHNRKIAAKWARDLHGNVHTQVNKLKRADRAAVVAVIDKAVAAAKSAKNLDAKELSRASKELKANWDKLVRSTAAAKRPAAKKTAKKAPLKKRAAK